MKVAMTRRIRMTGSCPDFFMFATPSWTRRGGPEHDLAICRRTGWISCTCEDAMYRRKQGHIVETEKTTPCKHVAKLMEVLKK